MKLKQFNTNKSKILKKIIKISFIIVSLFIILACKTNNIEWNISEKPYTSNTIMAEKENTLVIRRIQNLENNDKYVEFKFYLSWDGVTRFVTRYNKFFPGIEETKDNIIKICDINFNMILDNYFYESLEDLEIQKDAKDRNDFSSNLVILTDEDPNMKLIITISNGQAIYEIWNSNFIEIENGTNEKMNIESKIYN